MKIHWFLAWLLGLFTAMALALFITSTFALTSVGAFGLGLSLGLFVPLLFMTLFGE